MAEEEEKGNEEPAGERLRGPGKAPQCGENIQLYNHIYQFLLIGKCKFLKDSLLHILPQSLRWFQLVSYLLTVNANSSADGVFS